MKSIFYEILVFLSFALDKFVNLIKRKRRKQGMNDIFSDEEDNANKSSEREEQ